MVIKVKVQPLRPYMMFTDKNGNLTKDAYDFLFAIFQRVGGSLSDLDAASLLGGNWSNPNPIGDQTPTSGKFTTLQAVNGFGCNGTNPQAAYTVGAAVANTGSISGTGAFGYTTAAQANDIVTKLNAVIAALKANGIIV